MTTPTKTLVIYPTEEMAAKSMERIRVLMTGRQTGKYVARARAAYLEAVYQAAVYGRPFPDPTAYPLRDGRWP